jgi:hypothetical protein
MIVIGIILLLLGFLLAIPILWTLGIIVLVVGLVLLLLGSIGHAVGPRRHYWERPTAPGPGGTLPPGSAPFRRSRVSQGRARAGARARARAGGGTATARCRLPATGG